MKYTIPEVNLHKLENEMKSLENKIKKYGGNFSYKVLGEHFEEVEINGENKKVLFFDIEVEGELKFNDWEYCASIENTDEGNIIVNKDGGNEIPSTYYHSAPKCDHCNSNRYRRYTYIIRNSKSGDYKQVGKACLEDYTKGLSANAIAQLAEFFKNIEVISKDRSNEIYYENTEELLINLQAYLDKAKIRYYKTFSLPENYDGSRDLHVTLNKGYIEYKPCKITWTPKKVNCGYTPKNFYDAFIAKAITVEEDKLNTYKKLVNKARDWYANQEDDKGNEFHNYKTLIKQEEIPFEDVGILCNGFVAYLQGDDLIKENFDKYTKIREEYLAELKIKNEEEDKKALALVNELQSYHNDENLENKFVNVTIVKCITVKGPFSSEHYYVDSMNNVYDISYLIVSGVDTSKKFLVKNLKVGEKKTVNRSNLFHDREKYNDIEITYYDTDSIRENDSYWSKRITTSENTENIVYEVYDSRAELLGEKELVNEFAGDVDEVITSVINAGLKKITSTYKGVILYEGLDEEGRTIGVWSKKQLETEKPVKLTGKIWKQNSYRGKKSTIINIQNLEVL